MVTMGHKITNVQPILKILDILFVFGKLVYGPFLGAATKRWILQHLHSETVYHISVYHKTEVVAYPSHHLMHTKLNN
jgi:hypothetical protein